MNLGINLSGAEYEVTGNGATDTHFVFPTQAQIDYYGAKGFSQIRLPLSWERLQPTLNGELNQAYVAELRDVIAYAQERGISVIIDVHNYGYYEGNLIGSSAVPVDAFANLWGRIGEEFSDSSNVVFGLMNEPQLATAGDWLVAVNAAIGALRDAGADQQVLVPGTDWDTANRWTENGNADVLGKPGAIIDPAKNFAFEVHQYLDDTSGQNAWVVSETIGVERLKAITEWAYATGNKLYLGEFGVADNPLALAALTKMMDYIAANPDVWEGGSYWAGGHGWTADYMYSAEPDFGLLDAPQMAVLEQYTGVTTTTTTLPDGSVQVTTRPEGDHVPSIIDLFDSAGHLTSRTLLDGNDNPVRMIEPGADGSNTVTIYEEPGQQMSVTVEIYDHNNARVSESITAADGTTVVHQYDPGAHDPKLDTYYGSDGAVLKTVEHAADCVTITTYHDSAVSTVELCDISWQLLSRSTYNADGDLVSRQTDNADGTHSIEQFDAHTGIVTTSAEYSATWHSVSNTNFDSNGHIASVITEMDGGQKRVEVYAPGDSDFSRIETYSADWKIVSRVSHSGDNGFVSDTFSAPGSARVEVRQVFDEHWNLQSTTHFGANQQITSIQLERADGTHAIETYTASNQHTPATIDLFAADWTMQSRTHLDANGVVTTIDAVNPDHSHTVDTFAAGSEIPLTSEHYTADWQLVSRTRFDAEGRVAQTQYDNADGSHSIENYAAASQSHPATIDLIDADWKLLSRTHLAANGEVAAIDRVEADGNHTVTTYDANQQVASVESYASDWTLLSRQSFAPTVEVAHAADTGLTQDAAFDFSAIDTAVAEPVHQSVPVDVASFWTDDADHSSAYTTDMPVADPIDVIHHDLTGYDLVA